MNIYITLDYELFLGKETGSVTNCIIRPMAELNKISEKYNVFYTIFIDSAYLLRLYDIKSQSKELQKDWTNVCQNLKELAQKGHDIELHFHPQWLFSTYNAEREKWYVDSDHYKMSDVEDKDFLRESFAKAKNLLEKVVGKNVVAFRAGGY